MYIYHIFIISIILISTIVTHKCLVHITERHKNFKKRNLCLGYYLNCFINTFVAITLYLLIIINLKSLWENVHFPNIITIFAYLVIVDSCFYWLHRTIHRIPFLKEQLHMTHHSAYDLVPLDLYYTDIKEHIIYTLLVGTAPLFFLNINVVDYILANIIIFFHALHTHSATNTKFMLPLFIDSKYHKYHHQIGKGNYAVYFNIWDNYMGTRIKPTKKKKPRENHSLKTSTI